MNEKLVVLSVPVARGSVADDAEMFTGSITAAGPVTVVLTNTEAHVEVAASSPVTTELRTLTVRLPNAVGSHDASTPEGEAPFGGDGEAGEGDVGLGGEDAAGGGDRRPGDVERGERAVGAADDERLGDRQRCRRWRACRCRWAPRCGSGPPWGRRGGRCGRRSRRAASSRWRRRCRRRCRPWCSPPTPVAARAVRCTRPATITSAAAAANNPNLRPIGSPRCIDWRRWYACATSVATPRRSGYWSARRSEAPRDPLPAARAAPHGPRPTGRLVADAAQVPDAGLVAAGTDEHPRPRLGLHGGGGVVADEAEHESLQIDPSLHSRRPRGCCRYSLRP